MEIRFPSMRRKRYDLATGQKKSSCHLCRFSRTDDAEYLIFGMDLTPLIQDDSLDVLELSKLHQPLCKRCGKQDKENVMTNIKLVIAYDGTNYHG